MNAILKKIFKLFIEPRLAFVIFILFILIYLIVLDEEGAFSKKFLHFGPSNDTKFLTMTLDTWEKVFIVYAIGFFSTFLTTYYNNVSNDFIHSYLWNPAYTKTIKISKTWTQLIVTLEPILYWVLSTLNFFINLTFELQFLIPKLLGGALIDVPYGLYKSSQKKYIK